LGARAWRSRSRAAIKAIKLLHEEIAALRLRERPGRPSRARSRAELI
jgi:hypothetical protein